MEPSFELKDARIHEIEFQILESDENLLQLKRLTFTQFYEGPFYFHIELFIFFGLQRVAI